VLRIHTLPSVESISNPKTLRRFAPRHLSDENITADIRFRYAPSKLPLATSFIRKTLYEMAVEISIEEKA